MRSKQLKYSILLIALSTTGCAGGPAGMTYTGYHLSVEPPGAVQVETTVTELKAAPNSPMGHYETGLDLYKKRDYEHAIPEFQESRRLNPDIPANYFFLEYCYTGLGEPVKANQAIKALTTRNIPLATRSDAFKDLGFTYLDLDNAADAKGAFIQSLTMKPDEATAYYGLAEAAARCCELDAAKRYFRTAAKVAKSTKFKAQAHAALGKLALDMGDIATAKSEFKTALSKDPKQELALSWGRSL
ncbi:MAG: tetratricopeptide repeat protein [Chthonomonadales bacterium]